MAPKHPQPLLLVSFAKAEDVRRAYEALRGTFKCEFEDGGILIVGGSPSDGWTLEHNPRTDAAYREVEVVVSEELRRAEATGSVPTLEGRQLSRPDPNQLSGWARVLAWLVMEDPAGEGDGKRLEAIHLVGAFNDRVKELGLEGLLVKHADKRKFYTALRATIDTVRVESTNRTYVSGIDWTPEARKWRALPPFKAPYVS